jgi:hypothetical protein
MLLIAKQIGYRTLVNYETIIVDAVTTQLHKYGYYHMRKEVVKAYVVEAIEAC